MKILSCILFAIINTFGGIVAQNDSLPDAWTRYMMPGPTQEFLASYAGKWNMEARFYSSRDAEAQVFALDAVSEMILGNRFLQMKQSGLMAGMPFEALLLLGFNTTANEFSSTQLSNFGTGTLSLSGGWNKIYQNINLYGKMKNPGNGETVWVRQTLEFKDKNTLYISNYDRTEGMAEYLNTEYIFTRK